MSSTPKLPPPPPDEVDTVPDVFDPAEEAARLARIERRRQEALEAVREGRLRSDDDVTGVLNLALERVENAASYASARKRKGRESVKLLLETSKALSSTPPKKEEA